MVDIIDPDVLVDQGKSGGSAKNGPSHFTSNGIGRVPGQALNDQFRNAIGDQVTDYLERQNEIARQSRLTRQIQREKAPHVKWERDWQEATGAPWTNPPESETTIAQKDTPIVPMIPEAQRELVSTGAGTSDSPRRPGEGSV